MDLEHQIKLYQPQTEQEEQDQRMILELLKTYGEEVLFRSCRAAHLTSSGFILNQTLDKCLFAYHRIFDAWGWTGGHADGDPDLLKVALREAREETGLKAVAPYSREIASIDILPVHGHRKNGYYVSAHLHLCAAYLLVADENEVIRPKMDENSAVKWIRLDEINEYCREAHMLPIYEKLRKRIEMER